MADNTNTDARTVAASKLSIPTNYPADANWRAATVLLTLVSAAARHGKMDFLDALIDAVTYDERWAVVTQEFTIGDRRDGPWRLLIVNAISVLPVKGEENDDAGKWGGFVNAACVAMFSESEIA